jgi:hypothetical protein
MTLEPLNIRCTSTKCQEGKHFYRPQRTSDGASGPCRECGADPVDWSRVHKRNLSDVKNTFSVMRTELIRDVFWNAELDEKAINHARRKGWEKLREDIEKRVRTALAPVVPFWDGRQTPRQGQVIYYAQHATGTCCRSCLAEWHNIPKGRAMTEDEIAYCAELIRLYITERMPNLPEEGVKVPPIRQRSKSASNTAAQIDDILESKRKRGQDAED